MYNGRFTGHDDSMHIEFRKPYAVNVLADFDWRSYTIMCAKIIMQALITEV